MSLSWPFKMAARCNPSTSRASSAASFARASSSSARLFSTTATRSEKWSCCSAHSLRRAASCSSRRWCADVSTSDFPDFVRSCADFWVKSRRAKVILFFAVLILFRVSLRSFRAPAIAMRLPARASRVPARAFVDSSSAIWSSSDASCASWPKISSPIALRRASTPATSASRSRLPRSTSRLFCNWVSACCDIAPSSVSIALNFAASASDSTRAASNERSSSAIFPIS
mmetsp:Transcript_107568/g.302838  ORF Transcript_107568/g.302838 Transcript_107568/m.302838 type:complete len:228 (+) Transcript_107568:308-991(+)